MDKKVAWQIHYNDKFFEMLKIAAEEGFKYVAVGFGDQKIFQYEDWEEKIVEIKKALDENGVLCIQTHAPYYDLRISAEITDEKFELGLLRCIKATAMLGAEICAVHPRGYYEGGVGDEIVEESFRWNKINFEPLVKEAEKCGCMLGIENLPIFPGWDKSFYSCFPKEHARLIDCYNSPAVCGVWDFGHAHLTGMRALDRNPKDLLLEVGSRIKGTHVHNNFLTMDAHLAPPLGTINWEEVLGALASTGFDGYLTLEVSEPEMAVRPFIRYLYESVCELYDIMNG